MDLLDDLPTIHNGPSHHPDCCLTLSQQLIRGLSAMLAREAHSGLVLSVGSGSGLLEALLHNQMAEVSDGELWIEGVEVASRSASLNRYLPEELTNVVSGTRVLSPRVSMASVLMFVYPRTTWLVGNYLELCAQAESTVRLVVWLGPKVDWVDFKGRFHLPGFVPVNIEDDGGLAEYEIMVALKRLAA